MKKLNLAVIGQGRSGKNIHGLFLHSAENIWYDVKYVVEASEVRREIAAKEWPDATVLASYEELYGKKDIDLVVNATYSLDHAFITRALINNGFNVLCEKPFGRTAYECDSLIRLAEEKGVKLYVFQQSFYAPFYQHMLEIIKEKKIGDIVAIDIKYNKLGRRWDWQTLQCMLGGNAYNTGPHPFGFALGFLDFAEDARVAFSVLKNTPLFAGDSDNYCRAILAAAGKPAVEVEISDLDAYNDYTIQLQGTIGTMRCTTSSYKLKYVALDENEKRAPVMTYLEDEAHEPIYCAEDLVTKTEEGNYDGNAFDIGTRRIYENIYENITAGKPMYVTAAMASRIIGVIETVHAQNPLKVKFDN